MNADLKQLIEISTVKGSLTADARNLIYAKADSLGVSKLECDIYIEGFLNSKKEQNKSINSNRKNWGIWLLICGIIDFIWGLYLASNKYTDDYALIFLISGALFVVFGIGLIGAFSSITFFLKKVPKKVVGAIFLSLGIISVIRGIFHEVDEEKIFREYSEHYLEIVYEKNHEITYFYFFCATVLIFFGLHKLEKLKPALNKIKSVLFK
jgi:hypothetical protein